MKVIHVVAAVLGCLVCSLAMAQSRTPGASASLSDAEQSAAVQSIVTIFEQRYVFPQLRAPIVARLNAAHQSGRYAVADPVVFAERVTEDLRAVSHDKHLSLTVDPAGYAAALAPAESDAGAAAFQRRQAIRNHHGLTEMKMLGGNVRYLKITGFEWANDLTGSIYDDAMSFLREADAAIIDIRGNGGGSPSAVRYLVSHFMPADILEMIFLQGSEPPVQSRTLENLPAGRLQGIPLYVLIDGSVASAGEHFAYDVQQFKLGELVGTRTVGAANNNELLPVAPNFILSVSYGRPVHAVSGTNWEGVGVSPSVETTTGKALESAHLLALRRLSERPSATAEDLADYAWAQISVAARLNAVTLAPTRLKSLAGRYSMYRVDFRDGVLWLSRPDRESARLSPLTAEGLFSIEGVDHLRVALTGQAMELLRAGEAVPRIFPRR